MTSIQNRTLEFQQCVKTFNKQLNIKTSNAPTSPPSKSDFSKKASVIAKDIARVTQLLRKLTILIKDTPRFNDRPIEINELTYVIKQDIFKVEKSLKQLQQQFRGGTGQVDSFNKNVVNLLNTKTQGVSQSFKEILEIRQHNEISQRSRQEQYAADDTNDFNYLTLRSQKNASSISENPFSSSTNETIPADTLMLPESNQLLLLEEQSNVYLQDRNRAVETIESTISEIGNLFQQLSNMVSEQGEVIQRIDSNVEDISFNIHGAQRELIKYFHNVSTNRWLMLKIFGILVIFFVLWALVS
ncbi:cis-Golgi t-SNARE syntaxin [Komagataella phaffii CBS 7435]|uniref:Cis-Golgi t-SNARE syntaxin required for vesicular transport between the ER and the Golgi complex n=2 Tax=Komagataella phaffii TaxID=460519 RepID=C4QX85_KOMPG|nr:cis-Golgi t-SNARE syntaxin required for vesicular transport between the ER and the Golgi complex [Komagataella phaffii GS115]AOA60969.1 GQ67_02165T0 [Komagataella phaffii]CAH2446664.1 cis-Golgi t-SNARE syntaxin [Komagataella phaffii CBS 7435]AOA65835.1 GQ68_02180T0 [Komagataella phaffii GS115]CAY67858.1 cis-Golgi t-SNARE syntaxin required for vesicular transport between the ER and the Golgi complex [Komagataella phaffii GS115]CCA36939.1 cis-Golgi t-SNARE syntaxin [Komagataella phaffii CBS 7